jgi:hypothetical protein
LTDRFRDVRVNMLVGRQARRRKMFLSRFLWPAQSSARPQRQGKQQRRCKS